MDASKENRGGHVNRIPQYGETTYPLKEIYRRTIGDYFRMNPNASDSRASRELHMSRKTIHRYRCAYMNEKEDQGDRGS